jgi:hypothetical protein
MLENLFALIWMSVLNGINFFKCIFKTSKNGFSPTVHFGSHLHSLQQKNENIFQKKLLWLNFRKNQFLIPTYILADEPFLQKAKYFIEELFE